MSLLANALHEAGGTVAPRERGAQLRALLHDELDRSERELGLARSGRAEPVTIAFAAASSPSNPSSPSGPSGRPDPPDALLAVVPVPVAVRADPGAVSERGWLAVAATIGALAEIAGLGTPRGPEDLRLEAGALGGHLALRLPAPAAGDDDAELAVVAFEEHAAPITRLRSRALALPAHVLGEVEDWRAPIAQGLRSAEAVARLGGRPADGDSVAEHEEAVLALVHPEGAAGAAVAGRPHDDPDPARRIARRILQRLNGMGKWGGYHTDVRHLSRGFAGNERALAHEVGEALIASGLLAEKPSVGQRHVFLNPRRAADIHALIDRGVLPRDLHLP